MTCPAETTDTLWRNDHFCTHTQGHNEDHECLCGYTWRTT
jgi:hypothetical protein